MDEYISKTVKIDRAAEQIYHVISDLSLIAKTFPTDKIEQIESIEATTDECTVTLKGTEVGLKILEREQNSFVKYTGMGSIPFEFLIWIQLKEVAPYDTRMRIVLKAKMNMIMKFALKGKIKDGLDKMADTIANAMNGKMPEGFDPNTISNFT